MLTKADIEKFFLDEKQSGLILLVIGVIAILLAIAFFAFLKGNFYKGAAIPLLLIGLFEVFTGYGIYKRSDEERIRTVYAYDMNPGDLKTKELPQLQKALKSIVLFRWIELGLVVAGLVLVLLYRPQPDKAFWYGLGFALALQALVMFFMEVQAERNVSAYSKSLAAYVATKTS